MARPFEKGNPGRPKGAIGKLNRTVKETVLAVFNKIQEDPVVNLEAWAQQEPTEFYKIAAKLIPTEVQATVDATLKWEETKKYVKPDGVNPEADAGIGLSGG